MNNTSTATLYYFHDPMCSWCWGFSGVFSRLTDKLPGGVKIQRVLGGLAVDTDQPMPEELREHLQSNWRKIENRIPGVKFNFDFWEKCQPRRSTYPACRAVIAAGLQGTDNEIAMIRAIQSAYYQQARNPSDNELLIQLASEIGLDSKQFAQDIVSEPVEQRLSEEFELRDRMFVESFPTLLLVKGKEVFNIPLDYNNEDVMLEDISRSLS